MIYQLLLWTNLIYKIKNVKHISGHKLEIDENGWWYFDTFRYLKYVSMLLGQKADEKVVEEEEKKVIHVMIRVTKI